MDDQVPVGTILRDGKAVHVVDEIVLQQVATPASLTLRKRWVVTFRAPTEGERAVSDVMQT